MREIDDPKQLEAWLEAGTEPCVAVQSLHLDPYAEALGAASLEGSVFIACRASRELAGAIVKRGALWFSAIDDFTFPTHRARLYTPDELFEGFEPEDSKGYQRTFDHRVFAEYEAHGRERTSSIVVSLARRLHDHSITDALEELIEGRSVVAIMGGHGMERRDPMYAGVARIARTLTRHGFLLVSGGGPGAMEATHLGAYFAPRDDADLDAALEMLAPRPAEAKPGKEYADADWLHRAWAVRERFAIPAGREAEALSVGVPTWLYGHEPPAVFATQIAKYFANSVREDGLLSIASHGVIYAPGSAGTTQEIFQDVTQNHYATTGWVSPMILFGRDHWTNKRPVWPLLEKLGVGELFGELLALTDDEGEVVRRIRMYDPDLYRVPS
ncbi:MAG: hypothetical protein RMA76_08490 [Deltaproteobacteria bacterium]|jgi:predicted Rossmann-fold nucleotide-binding protein